MSTRTSLSTNTPTVAAGNVAKLKAVVRNVPNPAVLPVGNVLFKEGATTVATVPVAPDAGQAVARFESTTLSLGTHNFLATFVPTNPADFTTSTNPAPVQITVVPVQLTGTTTKVTSGTKSPVPGSTARVKAVVKPTSGSVKPSGNVVFREGTTTLGTVPLALVGTLMTANLQIPNISAGSHTITGTYAGNGSFQGSSGSVTISAAKSDSACTLTQKPSSANPLKTTITVVVKSNPLGNGVPGGLVTFVIDGGAPSQATLSATGRATLGVQFTPGTTHTVTVNYAGDSSFNPSNKSLTFTTS